MGPLPIIFLIFLFLPLSASADYYRYVNKDGVPCYVDAMEKVPEAHKNQITFYIERTREDKKAVPREPLGTLLTKKKELDDEYIDLMNEKEQLLESIQAWEKKYKIWENKQLTFHEEIR